VAPFFLDTVYVQAYGITIHDTQQPFFGISSSHYFQWCILRYIVQSTLHEQFTKPTFLL